MSEIYSREYWMEDLEVPEEILPFLEKPPRLLPGDNEHDLYRLFELMVNEIIPDTPVEWLVTIDLAWLWIDIQRYRSFKNAIILQNRKSAIEFALAATDPAAVVGMNPLLRGKARIDAETLRTDANKRNELTTRLQAHGYDDDALNAAAFVQGIEPLVAIEKFLASARHQVAVLLRELGIRREFARRAKEALDRFLADLKSKEQAIANTPGSDTEAGSQ